jgi:hypothetical protein
VAKANQAIRGDRLYAENYQQIADRANRTNISPNSISTNLGVATRHIAKDIEQCTIKNLSGSARGKYEILSISGFLYDPSTDLGKFKTYPAFTGVTPTEIGKPFVILMQASPVNANAWAISRGLVNIQINVVDEAHQFADVTVGSCSLLSSAESGMAQILCKESGTGTKWATLRMGNTASGGTAAASATRVKIIEALVYTMDGVPGRAYNTCRLVGDATEAYNAETQYALNAECIGSDNLKYISIDVDEGSGFNVGHDPISSPDWWEQAPEIRVYYMVGFRNVANFDLRDCDTWYAVGETNIEIVSVMVFDEVTQTDIQEYHFIQNLGYSGLPENSTERFNTNLKHKQNCWM